MLDNIAVTAGGQILLQEDPGNQPYVAKLWMYDIASGKLALVARHDPARFVTGGPGFLTQDEESSGVIDASGVLGQGWYLLDVQAHYAKSDPALVEGGQYLALHIPPGKVKQLFR
jgi:hypothetical protein